jgi:hypothetical protein
VREAKRKRKEREANERRSVSTYVCVLQRVSERESLGKKRAQSS